MFRRTREERKRKDSNGEYIEEGAEPINLDISKHQFTK